MIYLFIATFFWGSTFIAQRHAAALIDPFLFNGARFFVAGVIVVIALRIFKIPLTKQSMVNGALCGGLVFLAINLQQIGILHTTAGKSGIITGLYLLFIPLILLTRGRKMCMLEIILLSTSLCGFYLLSAVDSLDLNKGDVIVLISAIVFSFQVIAIGAYSKTNHPLALAGVQFVVCGFVSLATSLFTTSNHVCQLRSTAFETTYACLGSVLIGYTLQVVGQRKTSSTKAAFVMSLEGPLAMLLGMLILNETQSDLQYLGAALISLSALAIIQFPNERSAPTNTLTSTSSSI